MTERAVFVCVDLDGTPVLVGKLHARFRKNRESATFTYDPSWLSHPSRFALEPALVLHDLSHYTHTGQAMFGAFGDSAPDRWGRMLMRRAERRRAKAENRAPRTLNEIDCLLGVDDETRQGALRFAEQPGGPFLAVSGVGPRVPPLVELPALLGASDRIAVDEDTEDDLRLLVVPGSSLGGSRPKASVRDHDNGLLIAKFPHPGDEVNQPAWESLALRLASCAGINASKGRLETVVDRSVLLLNRFDRVGIRRIPFLSAMSLLRASDNESHSYLEIADALRQCSAAPSEDLVELWRRIVFSILISNVDDHLRNHGLLWEGPAGWRLAPAYDLNPTPTDIRPRVLSLAVDDQEHTASLELAFQVAEYFGIGKKAAHRIANEIGQAVASWRNEAQHLGIRGTEIDRMASAFEHADLRQAINHP
ncbi:MAG TPA: type II toxin-antitoxin system HipA family toxin [Pirellulales bacterium]|nr:type II toxin-antitoxin system HipA family toxin [Pirellulales bacterium]